MCIDLLLPGYYFIGIFYTLTESYLKEYYQYTRREGFRESQLDVDDTDKMKSYVGPHRKNLK